LEQQLAITDKEDSGIVWVTQRDLTKMKIASLPVSIASTVDEHGRKVRAGIKYVSVIGNAMPTGRKSGGKE